MQIRREELGKASIMGQDTGAVRAARVVHGENVRIIGLGRFERHGGAFHVTLTASMARECGATCPPGSGLQAEAYTAILKDVKLLAQALGKQVTLWCDSDGPGRLLQVVKPQN